MAGGVVHELGEISMTGRDIHDITKAQFPELSV